MWPSIPGAATFGDYSAGETADVTVPIDEFLVDFLTSGSLSAPEPLEFGALMIGAGGGGQSIDKSDLQSGFDRVGPPLRIDAGYHVPLANGIDLAGAAILTHLRFQLLDLEIFNKRHPPRVDDAIPLSIRVSRTTGPGAEFRIAVGLWNCFLDGATSMLRVVS